MYNINSSTQFYYSKIILDLSCLPGWICVNGLVLLLINLT
jgi:hypothetical protein